MNITTIRALGINGICDLFVILSKYGRCTFDDMIYRYTDIYIERNKEYLIKFNINKAIE